MQKLPFYAFYFRVYSEIEDSTVFKLKKTARFFDIFVLL